MPNPEKLRKITIMLPENMVDKAIHATGVGLTRTIRQGLQAIIAARASADARALRGKMKFSLDFDALRREDR